MVRPDSQARRQVGVLTPPGLSRLVERALRSEGVVRSSEYSDDGFVVVRASQAAWQIARRPYVKRAFDVITQVPRTDPPAEIRQVAARIRRGRVARRNGSFRVRVHSDGQFMSDRTLPLGELERAVAAAFGGRPERRGGAREYWIVRRRDSGLTFFVTHVPTRRERRPKGSLRPEVAAAMASLVPIDQRTHALDPFCGSGSLGIAMAEAGFEAIVLNDVDEGLPDLDLIGRDPSTTVVHGDFEQTARLGPFSAVVTDPPWGDYGSSREEASRLLRRFAGFLPGALAPGGRVVCLVSRELGEELTGWTGDEMAWDAGIALLVQGHRATVLSGARR